ncbi:hypothetical protein StrepF001_25155 [Streptomyces sp. F001]|uniref:hypothetical protein n=1 Tax=Streptomyces sp. F001 TaxID=1510026 RepID=UPI00101E396E|nr:hypothetical protein [Streptomyces sp. F001]RZB16580.1 hypothetical protein StrepF001_25155 [Streptomyces sp. F001]
MVTVGEELVEGGAEVLRLGGLGFAFGRDQHGASYQPASRTAEWWIIRPNRPGGQAYGGRA